MKKFLKITAIVIGAIALLLYGYLEYSTAKNHAPPTELALGAMQSGDGVEVSTRDDWVVMQPQGAEPDTGMIFYPGAYCDIRGYAPVLKPVAAAGYLVVAVEMPFDFAIFAPDAADEVREAFPAIRHWVIAGHSMGGAMAGYYAFNHQNDLAGLILWDSYPPEGNSLADSSLPVTHVHRARPDGTPSTVFTDMQHVYPPDALWVPIAGGNHMQFGSFTHGSYVEEWDAEIDADAQHKIVIEGTLAGLARARR